MVLFVSFLDLVGVARCESVFICLFHYLFGFLKGSRIIQDLMHKMKGWKNFKIIFVRIFTHDGCVPHHHTSGWQKQTKKTGYTIIMLKINDECKCLKLSVRLNILVFLDIWSLRKKVFFNLINLHQNKTMNQLKNRFWSQFSLEEHHYNFHQYAHYNQL